MICPARRERSPALQQSNVNMRGSWQVGLTWGGQDQVPVRKPHRLLRGGGGAHHGADAVVAVGRTGHAQSAGTLRNIENERSDGLSVSSHLVSSAR